MRDSFQIIKAQEILGKTKRKVNKGEVILTSKPFAYVINESIIGQYCDYCLESTKNKFLHSCKSCNFVYYCSDHCEFAASDIHNIECRALNRIKPVIPPNFARFCLRIFIRLQNGDDKYAETFGGKKSRKFKDLMNHYRDIKESPERMKDVHQMYKYLESMIGTEMPMPNESDFIGIYGRALVNCFCLMDNQMNTIGLVLYLAASIFDHSCLPNAYPCFTGNKIEIRSLVDWQEFDINKVYISYIDIIKTTAERQEDLKNTWYFWCACPLCLNKDRALMENCLKCDNPDCGAPVLVPEKPESKFMHAPMEHPKCTACGCPVDDKVLEEYQSAVAFTKYRLNGMKEELPELETCLAILEKQGKIFSARNVWRVQALDLAFNATYSSGVYTFAVDHGRNNYEAMRYYYGSDHPSFGLFLMKLGKCLLYTMEYREGLKCVEESESILANAIGKRHNLITDEIERLKAMANEDIEILLETRMAQHELVYKHCGKRKNGGARIEVREVRKVTEKDNKLNFETITPVDTEGKEYTTKPQETTSTNSVENGHAKEWKWNDLAKINIPGNENKKLIPLPADFEMSNYLNGTEGTKSNKYKNKQTQKVWDKLLSESEIRWARYVAETEFNNALSKLKAIENEKDIDENYQIELEIA